MKHKILDKCINESVRSFFLLLLLFVFASFSYTKELEMAMVSLGIRSNL